MRPAVKRTIAMMNTAWLGNNVRLANGASFLKRCKKRDARRKIEKASRKRNR